MYWFLGDYWPQKDDDHAKHLHVTWPVIWMGWLQRPLVCRNADVCATWWPAHNVKTWAACVVLCCTQITEAMAPSNFSPMLCVNPIRLDTLMTVLGATQTWHLGEGRRDEADPILKDSTVPEPNEWHLKKRREYLSLLVFLFFFFQTWISLCWRSQQAARAASSTPSLCLCSPFSPGCPGTSCGGWRWTCWQASLWVWPLYPRLWLMLRWLDFLCRCVSLFPSPLKTSLLFTYCWNLMHNKL